MHPLNLYGKLFAPVFSAALLSLCGCSMTGPERADQAANGMQATGAQVEGLKAGIDGGLSTLNDLTQKPQADIKPQFDAFTKAVVELERQSKLIGQRSEEMRAKAGAYFKAWEEDIAKISSPDLRKHSTDRRATLLGSFEKAQTSCGKTREAFDKLVVDLRDIQKVLSLDLTKTGLGLVADQAKKANTDGAAVKKQLDGMAQELAEVAKSVKPPPTASS